MAPGLVQLLSHVALLHEAYENKTNTIILIFQY